MDALNLLSLLRAFGKKGISKCELYGRVVGVIDRPANLHSTITVDTRGTFVEFDVFAVGLRRYEDYLRKNNCINNDFIYMVHGSVAAFVDSADKVVPEWYKLVGTLRFGTNTDSTSNYLSLFDFKKMGNQWYLAASTLEDLDTSSWDKSSDYYKWIIESGNHERVVIPDYVSCLPVFTHKLFSPTKPIPISNTVVEEQSNDTYKTINGFTRECRVDIKEANEYLKKFQDKIDLSLSVKQKYLSGIVSDYSFTDNSEYLRKMVLGLRQYMKRKPVQFALTGRSILQRYLSNFDGHDKKYMGTKVSGYLIDIFDEVSEYILDHSVTINCDGIAWDVCKSAFADSYKFYAGVVAIVLGFSFESFCEVYNSCTDAGLDFISVLNKNPYILQFVSDLSFDEIERVALCFGRHLDVELDEYRNIAILNDYISSRDRADTVFTRNDLLKANIGITLTKYRYNMMRNQGTHLGIGTYHNINAYIRDCDINDLSYSAASFVQVRTSYVRKLSQNDIVKALSDYERSGFGVALDNYITSTKLLNKELFVYGFMKTLGERRNDYSAEAIDSYIKEYEDKVGFILESRQRDAVHLIVHDGFIVAGGAGSGKTTVSNCVVYVLEKLEPNIDIQFATPTGKSAKRMQEVVHKEVKTLHSRFKLGLKQTNEFDEDSDDEVSDIAFFFDEGAMITIDLLYSVLKKIDPFSCRIFMFGDFDQLPPIGKGLPFKNLLRFMPCVFLNVSKRAAEGSSITANSNLINECSDAGTWRPLNNGNDFFLMKCKEEQIGRVVFDLCSYYLGQKPESDLNYILRYLNIDSMPQVPNLSADDIQVVTPLQKDSYSWGSKKLNALLQPLFNKLKGYENTFIYQLTPNIKGSRFILNDRVIHIEKNMYSMQWYGSYEDGELKKVYGNGICNGEVGKIVAFLPANDCIINDEEGLCPPDFEYPQNLRDDRTWVGDGKWFVVVEYFDYLHDTDIYILYRAEENTNIQSNEGIVLKGDDLAKLNLFYAGTTHKLQGSQAKLIICPLGDVNYQGFITRQMVYTMFTRAEKLAFGVGSVGNERDSMLSRARVDVASSGTKTIGEIII